MKGKAEVDWDALEAQWKAAWPDALATWSRFTRLRAPRLCRSNQEAVEEGLTGSFAMIRLVDQAVIVSLPAVAREGVGEFALEILAHEIGHHVLAPATLVDHGRLLARMRTALPTLERHAPMVANLYTDLLINDRLQRSSGLRIADVYRRLSLTLPGEGGVSWALYLRIYEVLWGLERGVLGGGPTQDRVEGDALLGARLVRSYARDWLEGAGRFAVLFFPHLLEEAEAAKRFERLMDTRCAGAGGEMSGLVDVEPGERTGAVHPAQDPNLLGTDEAPAPGEAPLPDGVPGSSSGGQAREPFEYGEILRACGLELTDHEAAVRYYRERARPHLVPFPSRRAPESVDPLPEGLEPWDIGHGLDTIDWFQSVLVSPRVVPGVTTVQRLWGVSPGREPKMEPFDLDLYVDSSGSMPDPARRTSYPALAGAIMALSALRAGARVQVTLWSGKDQFTSTDGFVRDEWGILRVLTGYFGGGTAFPIHVLRETYRRRPAGARPAHVLVLSDDGVSTLFDVDEEGNSGWDVAAAALAAAGGGGTLVLNLPENWESLAGPHASIRRARSEQGWQVDRVATLEDLVEFARRFSRRRYGPPEVAAAREGWGRR